MLEERFPETRETHPELLAHHYTEAGLNTQAIPDWQQAGQRAIERSANIEAISHLTKGIEGLAVLPETPERLGRELTFQLALGGCLTASQGYGALDVERVYARARALCQQLGETPQLFPALWGLYAFDLVRGHLPRALEIAEQLLHLAQQDAALQLMAHRELGVALFYLGELALARAHLGAGAGSLRL